MNAVVMVLEGLGAHWLGCYGQPWVETPNLDRLAAGSVLFDSCFAPAADTRLVLASWQALDPGVSLGCRCPAKLGQLLNGAGCPATLAQANVSAQPPELAEAWHRSFESVLSTEASGAHPSAAVAELAGRWLADHSAAEPFLLVVRLPAPIELTGAPGGAADANEGAAESGSERDWLGDLHEVELSPEQVTDVEVPIGWTELQVAFADAIEELDEAVGSLLQSLEESAVASQTLVAALADCGLPVSPSRGELMLDELLHVPLLLRLPGRPVRSGRRQALVSSCDFWHTLLELVGAAEAAELQATRSLQPLIDYRDSRGRDYLLIPLPDDKFAIRTEHWLFVASLSTNFAATIESAQLYVKPEDRWERNDVSHDYPDVVEQFARLLATAVEACRAHGYARLPPLPAEVYRAS